MMRITHCVFFFCVSKDTFNRLFAHGVDFFPSIRSPQLFHKVQILLPDVRGQELLAFFFRSTPGLEGTALAVLGIAAVCSFSFPVCGGMPQLSAVRTNEAVFFWIVFVFPWLVYALLAVMVRIRKYGDSSVIQRFLRNPRGFVPRIHCYEFCFRKSLRYLAV